jgi:hypothetical protein
LDIGSQKEVAVSSSDCRASVAFREGLIAIGVDVFVCGMVFDCDQALWNISGCEHCSLRSLSNLDILGDFLFPQNMSLRLYVFAR